MEEVKAKVENKSYTALFRIPFNVTGKVHYFVYVVSDDRAGIKNLYRVVTDREGNFLWKLNYVSFPDVFLNYSSKDILNRTIEKKSVQKARRLIKKNVDFVKKAIQLHDNYLQKYIGDLIFYENTGKKMYYKFKNFSNLSIFTSASQYFDFLPDDLSFVFEVNLSAVKRTMLKTKLLPIVRTHYDKLQKIYKFMAPLTQQEVNLISSFHFYEVLSNRHALYTKDGKVNRYAFLWTKEYALDVMDFVLSSYERRYGHLFLPHTLFENEKDVAKEKLFLNFLEYIVKIVYGKEYDDDVTLIELNNKSMDFYEKKYGEDKIKKMISDFNNKRKAECTNQFFCFNVSLKSHGYEVIRKIPASSIFDYDQRDGKKYVTVRDYNFTSLSPVKIYDIKKEFIKVDEGSVVFNEPLFRGVEM